MQGDWTEWVTRARMADRYQEAERERLARSAQAHEHGKSRRRLTRRHARMNRPEAADERLRSATAVRNPANDGGEPAERGPQLSGTAPAQR
jgi:hypothetical protein